MVESEMLRPSLKIIDIFLRQNFQTSTIQTAYNCPITNTSCAPDILASSPAQ